MVLIDGVWLEKEPVKVANIHRCKFGRHGESYAVCNWSESGQNWTRPLDANEARSSDCLGEYSQTKEYFGGFTKAQAYSRAQTLYRYARIQKEF